MEPWKILVVDDDADVHSVTRLSLKRLVYRERSIQLIYANSATEAKTIMEEVSDIAIILLDIVMEEEDAGLQFIHYVRKVLKNTWVQIVIRTGHPGSAPEEMITIEYDINDYQEKSELSSRKLKTTVITALRSYMALKANEEHRLGLKQVIDASLDVFKYQSRRDFEIQALVNLSNLLEGNSFKNETHSGVVARKNKEGELYISSAIGIFQPLEGKPLIEIVDQQMYYQLLHYNFNIQFVKIDNFRVLGFNMVKGQQLFVIVEDYSQPTDWQNDLLEAFRLNVFVALDNLYLYREVEAARNDLVFALGEIAESRSAETGNHVKRVGEIAKIMAIKLGKDEREAEQIRMAASLHDLGKLAIQEEILNKPGKFTKEEFEIMQSHSRVGFEMLRSSNRVLLKSAAIIALEHHENYDGTGYPNGLEGDEISQESRIVAIADVFDALGNKRVYKEAWDKEAILDYMKSQAGKKFDPKLVNVFFEHIDELVKVRERYPD